MRLKWVVLTFILVTQCARGDDIRWCTIAGVKAEKAQALVYPAIAKAGHVEGIVILRVTFETSGVVKAIDSVSGPKLLADPATHRTKDWQFKTDATGSEPCQNLVIIRYRILPENYTEPEAGSVRPEPQPTGSYLIRIDALTIRII